MPFSFICSHVVTKISSNILAVKSYTQFSPPVSKSAIGRFTVESTTLKSSFYVQIKSIPNITSVSSIEYTQFLNIPWYQYLKEQVITVGPMTRQSQKGLVCSGEEIHMYHWHNWQDTVFVLFLGGGHHIPYDCLWIVSKPESPDGDILEHSPTMSHP